MEPLLIILFLCLTASVAQTQVNITAESGQTVTLPCRAPENKILAGVEWSRPDLEPEYVLLYRDGHIISDYQEPSFKNRVELQYRQMKDGDVSLILKDVTINDSGTYECQALTPGRKRQKRAVEPISSIYLSVAPPGQPGGHTEDGGKEGGAVGLAVGLSVSAVLLLLLVGAVVGFLSYKKRNRKQSPGSSQPPPVELQLLEHV